MYIIQYDVWTQDDVYGCFALIRREWRLQVRRGLPDFNMVDTNCAVWVHNDKTARMCGHEGSSPTPIACKGGGQGAGWCGSKQPSLLQVRQQGAYYL